MKLYVTDLPYAKAHEAELRKLRLSGNLVALCAELNRQGLMRTYYTLANIFISDHGEFVFSGCHILFNKRSEHLEKVIDILKKENVRFSIAMPYTNACGGLNIIAQNDQNVPNEKYTYAMNFDSDEQKERVQKQIESFCMVKDDGELSYLVFHDSSYKDAVEAAAKEEKIVMEDVIFLSDIN